MKADRVPAAREVVMRRADDVHVMIEPRAIGLEVAALVYGDVSAETIRRLQDEEGFPCVRYGTRRLVPVAAADAWLAARALRDTLPPSAAVASRQADELAAADDSTFAQAFHAEMVTIYANSQRFRRMGLTHAIRCNRRLAVQQYRFLRRAGLTPNQARDRLYQIMFIGIAGAALIPGSKARAA